MQILFRTVPIYFWFLSIWSVSKVFQFILSQQKTVWEIFWDMSVEHYDKDEHKLFINETFVIGISVGALILLIFTFLDFSQKPAFIRKYKVNPQTNEPPDSTKFMKVLLYASFTGFFLVIPALKAMFQGLQWRGLPSLYPLPSIFTVIFTCFINDHIFDVVAYTVHRMLHHRFLYKHIHKMHHEYKSTIAVAVIHSHPIEHLVVNILPLASGIIITKCHIATVWIYAISVMLSSNITHSGYHLPFLNSPEFHDFHHMKFDCNYSVLGLMDWIFGTDKLYKNTIYQKRDRLLWSFKSAHELYPKREDNKSVKIN